MTKKLDVEEPGKVRTLQVELSGDRRFRVTVPATAKITYSPANTMHKDYSGMSLRIYEGASQIALFKNVESFFDISLPIVYEKKKSAVVKKMSSNGNGKVSSSYVAEADAEWGESEDWDA